MNSNINDLFTLTDYERDTSKLARNAGVALEMQALGLGVEVLGATVRPSVVAVEVDLTDWDRIIK
jgi:hypothetical protein